MAAAGGHLGRLDNLLRYVREVVRCVIYAAVRDGEVAIFAPLCAAEFRNSFHARLGPEEVVADLERQCGTDRRRWYLNGRLLCERPPRGGWGDYLFEEIHGMLREASAHLPRGRLFEFCVNKRDHALVSSPPGLDPYTLSPLPPALAEAARNLPPVLGFYTGPNHSDLAMPLPHDRFRTPPPSSPPSRNGVFFRGGLTGGGLRAWAVGALHSIARTYGVAVDAGITSVPRRWKWRSGGGGAMELVPPARPSSHALVPPVPEAEWGAWRCLIYCDGNAGATRWLGMFAHGSVVVEVPDPECPCPDMWAKQRMEAGVHYIRAAGPNLEALDRAIHAALFTTDGQTVAENGRRAHDELMASVRDGSALAEVILRACSAHAS